MLSSAIIQCVSGNGRLFGLRAVFVLLCRQGPAQGGRRMGASVANADWLQIGRKEAPRSPKKPKEAERRPKGWPS